MESKVENIFILQGGYLAFGVKLIRNYSSIMHM